MPAVWARVRAELRSGLRPLIALSVLLGVFGGVVMASAAAARRTGSAYDRFLGATKPPDVVVFSGVGHGGPIPPVDLHRVLAFPEVAEGEISPGLFGVARTTGGDLLWNGDVSIALPSSGANPYGGKLLSGRLPDPGRVDEVAVGYEARQDPRVHVGARIQLAVVRDGTDPYKVLGGRLSPQDFVRPPQTLTVIGVLLRQGQFQGSNDLFVTPAFVRDYEPRALSFPMATVRLRNGPADVAAFQQRVDRLAPGANQFSPGDEGVAVRRSTHILAISVWLFGVLAAIAGLLIFGQALVRRTFEESADNPGLRALGMTGGQLFAVGMARALMVGAGGAALAVGAALALSPLSPLGRLARVVEPHPGLSIDPLVVAGGAAGILVVAVLVGLAPAWRAARIRGGWLGVGEFAPHARPSAVAAWLARAGFPPSVVTGVRLALEPGHGRTSTPVRSAAIGAALSIGALAAALTFGSSFRHLVDTPRLYGRTWDIDLGNPFAGRKVADTILAGIERDPAITDISAASIDQFVQVGSGRGVRVNAWAIEEVRGHLHPTVVEGRWPASAGEIALGVKTLREAGAQVGDDVPVGRGHRAETMRIVGRAVFPDSVFGPGLGEGAGLTLAGMRALAPGTFGNAFAVRLAPGAAVEDEVRTLDRSFRRYGSQVEGPTQGTQLGNLRKIQALPLLLAGLLAAAAAAAIAHMLVTSVRRRRRDLAILKTLGFVRRQVSATVAWQATTVVLIALLVGVPLGLAAARWTWTYFADQLGVVPEPVVAVIPALLALPAALALANLVAAIPGRLAARTRPSAVLRTE